MTAAATLVGGGSDGSRNAAAMRPQRSRDAANARLLPRHPGATNMADGVSAAESIRRQRSCRHTSTGLGAWHHRRRRLWFPSRVCHQSLGCAESAVWVLCHVCSMYGVLAAQAGTHEDGAVLSVVAQCVGGGRDDIDERRVEVRASG